MAEGNFVTTANAAKILGVSTSTLYRMLDMGVFNPIKTPGGQRRFDIQMLEEFKEKSKAIESVQNPSAAKKTHKNILKFEEPSLFPTNDENTTKSKIKKQEKPVDKRNVLNDMNGSEWLPETKSFFYQKGLGANHPEAQIEKLHPAPFSYQDIQHLITFFTKKNMKVLDPFGGVGSTAKACELTNRICTSIELQKKWNDLAIERLDKEILNGVSQKHEFIQGDCRDILKAMNTDTFDFMVTSPPYWGILNKKADYKVKKVRLENNLATNYSNDDEDLANIKNYKEFLDILVNNVFLECARVLKQKKYMCLVVSDFRNKSEYVSFHSDLIQAMNGRNIPDNCKLTLQGTRILLQNHKTLLPYGYPFAYVENIHHQYVLIFRKDKYK